MSKAKLERLMIDKLISIFLVNVKRKMKRGIRYEWVNGLMNGWVGRLLRWINGWMHG